MAINTMLTDINKCKDDKILTVLLHR